MVCAAGCCLSKPVSELPRVDNTNKWKRALEITAKVLFVLAWVAGLAALTFFFPHTMIPIEIAAAAGAGIGYLVYGEVFFKYLSNESESSGIEPL